MGIENHFLLLSSSLIYSGEYESASIAEKMSGKFGWRDASLTKLFSEIVYAIRVSANNYVSAYSLKIELSALKSYPI